MKADRKKRNNRKRLTNRKTNRRGMKISRKKNTRKNTRRKNTRRKNTRRKNTKRIKNYKFNIQVGGVRGVANKLLNGSILNRCKSAGRGSISLQNKEEYDYVFGRCDAPQDVYDILKSIEGIIDKINHDHPPFKLESPIEGKYWWIKVPQALDRIVLRMVVGDFILEKGLNGIIMPNLYAVTASLTDKGEVEELEKCNYTDILLEKHRWGKLTPETLAAWHFFDEEKYPSVDIQVFKENIIEKGDRQQDEVYLYGNEKFKFESDSIFMDEEYHSHKISCMLLEHIDSYAKECPTHVGLQLMFLLAHIPLDIGDGSTGQSRVNFAVTENMKISIIDCEIVGASTSHSLWQFFHDMKSLGNWENHKKNIVEGRLSYGHDISRDITETSPIVSSWSYSWQEEDKGLFILYFFILTRSKESFSTWSFNSGTGTFNFKLDDNARAVLEGLEIMITMEDVNELKAILSSPHFSKCPIQNQSEILETLLSLKIKDY